VPLQGHLGRVDCGVFAEVLETGAIATGDTLSVA
jgi:MOSC domain-containing protein YiiM